MEAHESTWKLLESTLLRNHDDRIAERVFNSLTHHNLVHKFIPMHQAMKIPSEKPAVNQEWEKLEKTLAWQMAEVKSKKDVILDAQKEERKAHFAALMVICHLKNAELELKYQNYKGLVVLRGDGKR